MLRATIPDLGRKTRVTVTHFAIEHWPIRNPMRDHPGDLGKMSLAYCVDDEGYEHRMPVKCLEDLEGSCPNPLALSAKLEELVTWLEENYPDQAFLTGVARRGYDHGLHCLLRYCPPEYEPPQEHFSPEELELITLELLYRRISNEKET